ncbi:MAG: biotin--[Bacteroidales bacterium]|nr:biotin--[acetyl-CoA-carboxylase] ligase [Bacteroidales bacterium]
MSKKHDIIWLESVDSTNEEAKRHISDIDNLSVLSALEQTAGRGQRGNKWTSAPGENLMFTIVMKFSCDPASLCQGLQHPLLARDQFVLNEIASLSVVDFLSKHGISAKIKWPNDIYVGSEKICGILIENSLRGSGISSSIIGIGLNINQRNFNVNLPNPTSMVLCRENSGHSEGDETEQFDIRLCLSEFMDIFDAHVNRFLSSSPESPSTESYDSLRELYLSHLWRLNETARFIDYTSLPSGHHDGPMNPVTTMSGSSAPDLQTAHEGHHFTGIIRGLSQIGHLIVEYKEKGELKEFTFKEIGYIL